MSMPFSPAPMIAPTVQAETDTGTEAPPPIEKYHVGPQICYEGLYPDFSRGLAKAGADVIINLTNDSWFTLQPWVWRPFEPEQHGFMTLARAIEVRRPLIRSTNTGVSMGILPDGELLARSPTREEWYGQFTVPIPANPPLTLFARWGQWDLLMWGLIFGVFVWHSRRKKL